VVSTHLATRGFPSATASYYALAVKCPRKALPGPSHPGFPGPLLPSLDN